MQNTPTNKTSSLKDHFVSIVFPVIRLVFDVVVSVGITNVAASVLNLDVFQSIILGILVFVALVLLQIGYIADRTISHVSAITRDRSFVPEIAAKLDQILGRNTQIAITDNELLRISACIKEITTRYYGRADLFTPWYRNRLMAIRKEIEHTLETDSYFFDLSIIQEQDRLDNVFSGAATDHFLGTSSCGGIAWYLTASGSHYLRSTDKHFVAGRILSVKRLYIYDEERELADVATQLCFVLHKTSGYEYKVIDRASFNSVLRDFGERDLVSDFGVYGNHYVWETVPKGNSLIEAGIVSVNSVRIAKYTKLFSELWTHASEHHVNDEDPIMLCAGHRITDLRILQLQVAALRGRSATTINPAKHLGKWEQLAGIWRELGVPITSSDQDVANFIAATRAGIGTAARARVLLLGCTPELRNALGSEEFSRHTIYCVDNNVEMYREMSSLALSRSPREHFVLGDWTDFDLEEHVDVILGDKVLDNIPYLNWKKFFANMHRHLYPNGALVVHVALVADSLNSQTFGDIFAKWARLYNRNAKSLYSASAGLWDELLTASWARGSTDKRTLSLARFNPELVRIREAKEKLSQHEFQLFDCFDHLYGVTAQHEWTACSLADLKLAAAAWFTVTDVVYSRDYEAAPIQPILVLHPVSARPTATA